MARAALPITQFTTADGNALSNGFVLLRLNTDARTSSGQVCAGTTVRVNLDNNGVPLLSPTFPTNDTMKPDGTVYLLSAYTEAGAVVFEYLPVTITSPIDNTGFGVAFGLSFGS